MGKKSYRYLRHFIIVMTVCCMGGVIPCLGYAGQIEWGLATAVSERYDDNIYLQEHKESDYITSVTPELSGTYRSTDTEASLSYMPAFDFYADNSDENEVRHNGMLSLTSLLTQRLTLNVTDRLSFFQGQDVATEQDFIDRQTRSSGRNSDLQTNSLDATLSYQLLKKTTIRGGVGWVLEDYKNSDETDSDQYSLHLGADHLLTKQNTLFSTYQFRTIQYSGGGEGSQNDDSDIHSISVGDTHQFSSTFVFTGSGGISYIDQDNQSSETTWTCHADLNKAFRTGMLSVSYNRNVSPDSGGEGETTTTDTVNISGSKDLSRHLSGNLSTYYQREKSVSGSSVDDDYWGVIVGSNYQFSKQVIGNVSGSYIRKDSHSLNSGDTESYRTGVYLSYALRPGWSFFGSYRYYQQNALDQIEDDFDSHVAEIGTRITWF